MQSVTLWKMGEVWGLPSVSPFCLKLEAWMRFASVPYTPRLLSGPPKSPSGKVPYIELSDGTLLADSSNIIRWYAEHHQVDLDRSLGADQRALLTLIQRTAEEHPALACIKLN